MTLAPLYSRLSAELIGTFVLVLGGAGTAIFAASAWVSDDFNAGVGFLGVSLAFGLSVLVAAYAVGHISGGHFNPAVTLGALLAGRIDAKSVLPYWLAQIIGGSLAALLIYVMVTQQAGGYSISESGFALNGFGELSPFGFSLGAVLLAEFVLTFLFLIVILGATDSRAPAGFAPIAIGLALTLIHLVSIPISNTSVNPARSLAVAWFSPEALGQVWVFFLAPLAGAAVAGLVYKFLFPNTEDTVLENEDQSA
ncbi:aquaporin Z [Nesterenkonia muleiensis]|uniref:aquaporin Z n=1 Tax=Nesterenkonia muleiensis TaxID=2282648 RepID=UPI000E749D3F|nr:aquaporin Z [Nesterenkonia muleiensis]